MKIKVAQTYHNLALKPSIFKSTTLQTAQQQTAEQIQVSILFNSEQLNQNWKLESFNQLIKFQMQLNNFSSKFMSLISAYETQFHNEGFSEDSLLQNCQKIIMNLKLLKDLMKKTTFENVQINYNDIFLKQKKQNLNSIFSLYKNPINFQIFFLISQAERYMNQDEYSASNRNIFDKIVSQRFPYIKLFKQVCIQQLKTVLKIIKQNLYTPSPQIFNQVVSLKYSKFFKTFNQKQSKILQNLHLLRKDLKQFCPNEKQPFIAFYTLFVYQQCSTLQGLCNYLSYSKNILLDRTNGALTSDYETWVGIYQASLKLYCRNDIVKKKQLIQIDQILSTPFSDKQFYQFLIKIFQEDKSQDINEDEKIFNIIGLSSMNFYLKNTISLQKEKLRMIILKKILNILNSQNPWSHAQDIVQFIDNDCPNQDRNQIFIKIASNIQKILTQEKSFDDFSLTTLPKIKTGITLFLQSMSKHLQIVDKIFNIQNLSLMLFEIKEKKNCTNEKAQIFHHLLNQLIGAVYNESEQLQEYFQNEPKLLKTMLQFVFQFKKFQLSMSKQFYKIMINVIDAPQQELHQLDPLMKSFYFGVAQLFFGQSFEQSVDMQLFHADQRHRKVILDCIVQLFAQLGSIDYCQFTQFNKLMNNELKQQNKQYKQRIQTLLSVKSFKDHLIFQNLLLMTTYFPKDLPLQQVLVFLFNYYNPLTQNAYWKTTNKQGQFPITLLSLVAQQIPIQILKATYKVLKDGIIINLQDQKQISKQFWSGYFSNQNHVKITTITSQICQGKFKISTYHKLHNLKKLQLVLNLISCVFDKLNESSQKTIKQLKIMYEWGSKKISQILSSHYSIFINCMITKIKRVGGSSTNYCSQIQTNNCQQIQICDKSKNISVLEFNLIEENFLLSTFKQFNKIGKIILKNQIFNEVNQLLFPVCLSQSKSQKEQFKCIVDLFMLVQNSCLPQIISDDFFDSISQIHVAKPDFYQKANCTMKQFINSFGQQSQNFQKLNNLQKRLASHLKLQISKFFIPNIVKRLFLISEQESKTKLGQISETLNNSIKIVYILGKSYEEHFIQIMEVIEEVILKDTKDKQQKKDAKDTQQNCLISKSKVIITFLQLFFACILNNIKIRSYHLYRLIKIYLKIQKENVIPFNQVINHYIKLFFIQFIEITQYTENQEIKRLCKQNKNIQSNKLSENNNITTQYPQLQTPKKLIRSNHISSPEKQNFNSPIKKDKISLFDLKHKKYVGTPKSQNQSNFLCKKYKNIMHTKHSLNFAQAACTLSMFINLFSRLNYGSLSHGVQKLYFCNNDKIVYLKYLLSLTQKIVENQQTKNIEISKRDLQILNVDVFGNLSSIIKTTTINQELIDLIIDLSKKMIKLQLNLQGLKNMPLKILSARIFPSSDLQFGQYLSVEHFSLNNSLKKHDQNVACAELLLKRVKDFQNQPQAFQLMLKLHYYKLYNFVQSSNLHLCNLEYILKQKSNVKSKNYQNNLKKTLQLNRKIIMSRTKQKNKKDFSLLLKKYNNKKWQQQDLNINISKNAYKYIDELLFNFQRKSLQIIQILQNNKKFTSYQEVQHIVKIKQFYVQFKHLLLIVMNISEMAPYIMTRQLSKNSEGSSANFIKIILSNLKYDFGLPMFSQFFIMIIKTNSSFISSNSKQVFQLLNRFSKNQELKSIIKDISQKQTMIPLNLIIEIQLKLFLLNNLKEKNMLKALIFTLKNSNQHRFRFYKFLKLFNTLPEIIIKSIDKQILQQLTFQKQIKNSQQANNDNKHQSFSDWLQVFHIISDNFINIQLIDYGKIVLDKKLREKFIKNSQKESSTKQQQSILQSKQRELHTTNQIFYPCNLNFQFCSSIYNECINKINIKQVSTLGKKIISFQTTKETIINNQELRILKQFWSRENTKNTEQIFSKILIEELIKTSNDLAWTSQNTQNIDINTIQKDSFFQIKEVLMVEQSNDMHNFHNQIINLQNNQHEIVIENDFSLDNQVFLDQCQNQVHQNYQNDGIIQTSSENQSNQQERDNEQTSFNQFKQKQQNCDQIFQKQDDVQQEFKQFSSQNSCQIDEIIQQKTVDGSIKLLQENFAQQNFINMDGTISEQPNQMQMQNTNVYPFCTIDKLTDPEYYNQKNINGQLQIKEKSELESEVFQNCPLIKEDLLNLIQEITLNPELIKIFSKRLKRVNNNQIRRLLQYTSGEVKDIVQTQIKKRGIYLNKQYNSSGMMLGLNQSSFRGIKSSLFSINKFMSTSFHIDQSRLYNNNFKKNQSNQSANKIFQKFIPKLTSFQWTHLIFLYCNLSVDTELNNTRNIMQKQMLNLVMNLIIIPQNSIQFASTTLKFLQMIKEDQLKEIIGKFSQNFELNVGLKQVKFIIINDLYSSMLMNRIGLPILLKSQWNYEKKCLMQFKQQVRSTFSKFEESQQNAKSQKHNQMTLNILIKNAITLTVQFLQNTKIPNLTNTKSQFKSLNFLFILSQYFNAVQNSHSNESYPYYDIQDKLSISQQILQLFSERLKLIYSKQQQKDQSTNSILRNFFNLVMRVLTYLDLQFFSKFLQHQLKNAQGIIQCILTKELVVLKNFNKKCSSSIQLQKKAQIYWQMRKQKNCDQFNRQIKYLGFILIEMSSKTYQQFKQTCFKFAYKNQEYAIKQKIVQLNKKLLKNLQPHKVLKIQEEIKYMQKNLILWKSNQINIIIKQDIIPFIEKCSYQFMTILLKLQEVFNEIWKIFGGQLEQKVVFYKQCSYLYKILLTFQIFTKEEQVDFHSMSNLKTKPSLQSTKQMVTGRRRSSLKMQRISINLGMPNFKHVLKSISSNFEFFSDIIQLDDSEIFMQKDYMSLILKIHAKYSTIQSKLKIIHLKETKDRPEKIIQCRRQYAWIDTLPYLDNKLGQFDVKIKIGQQIGLDYGGVRRQWITLITKQLVNPNLGLFQLSANGLSFQPSRTSYIVPNHLLHFRKFGILVGKAMKQNWLLQINFTRSFLKHLLGFTIYVEDLQDIDPDTAKGLLWVLNNQIDEDFGITFTHDVSCLGKKTTIELIENGSEVYVNESNKKDYIKKLASYLMTQQIRQQSKAFMDGIEQIIPYQTLKLFSYKEIGIYLAGMPTININQMKQLCRYEGFSNENEDHQQSIIWFWKIMQKYQQNEQFKANFLFFLTGSYKVSYGGFKENPIGINCMTGCKDYLPVAHTCFSVIDISIYSSLEKFEKLLLKSLKEGKGFSIS